MIKRVITIDSECLIFLPLVRECHTVFWSIFYYLFSGGLVPILISEGMFRRDAKAVIERIGKSKSQPQWWRCNPRWNQSLPSLVSRTRVCYRAAHRVARAALSFTRFSVWRRSTLWSCLFLKSMFMSQVNVCLLPWSTHRFDEATGCTPSFESP